MQRGKYPLTLEFQLEFNGICNESFLTIFLAMVSVEFIPDTFMEVYAI